VIGGELDPADGLTVDAAIRLLLQRQHSVLLFRSELIVFGL
jgi:hypothetical protein